MQLTFSGSVGDYWALGIREIESGIEGANITVLKPDGSTLTTGSFTAQFCPPGGSCQGMSGYGVVNMGPLPASGTYTILVQQTKAGAGSLTLILSSPVASALTVGVPASVSASLQGQSMRLTFVGAAGDYAALGIQELGSGIEGETITVLKPDGGQLTTGTFTATCISNCSGMGLVNMGPLPSSGTYTILLQQTTGAAGSLTLSLSNPATAVLQPSTPTSVPVSLLGQGMRLTFDGSAGAYVRLQIAESGAMSYISGVTLKVLDANGVALTVGDFTASTCLGCGYSGSTQLNLPPLPATGTYTVIAQQKTAGTGTLTFTADGVTPSGGSSWNISTSTAGQNGSFTFSAVAQQSVALTVSPLAFTPSSTTYGQLFVYKPDGTVAGWTYCYVSNNGCVLSMRNLPVTGTYSAVMVPGGTATMSFTAALSPDVLGTLVPGTPLSLNLSTLGQNALLSFAATAGQKFALNVNGISSTPASNAYQFTVYGPNDAQVTVSASSTSLTLNLENLTDGTYTVLATPQTRPSTATMQVGLYSVAGGALTSGVSANVSTSTPSQNAYLSFSGTAGQSVALTVSGLAFTPSSVTYGTVNIYKPDGNSLTWGYCYANTNGCVLSVRNLPATGTYTALVTPGGAATMSFAALMSADVTGTLVPGTPLNLNLATLGQNALLSFAATTGQKFALNVNGISSTPASSTYQFMVYGPNGNSVPNGSSTSSTSLTFNLENLTAGTHTVLITPASRPATATMQVGLYSVAGAALTTGVSTNVSTSAQSQNAYLSFSGTAGQNLALTVSGLVLTPSSVTYATVNIYKPDGSSLTWSYCYVSSNGCAVSVPTLPATGTYSVMVIPGGAATMSFAAVLSADVTGTLAPGVPLNLNLATLGQNALLSFTASAGQKVTLNASGISSAPAGTTYQFTVYGPNGNTVTSTTSSTGLTFNLENLAAGTHTVLITPSSRPATATMQVALYSAAGGALTSGVSTNVNTSAPSQNAYLSFSGTAGQNVTLALSGLVFTPSSVTWSIVTVYKPDGTALTYNYCYPSGNGCVFSMRNLPATGTYTAVVVPGGAATMSFAALLSMDVLGTLTPGTPLPLTLSLVGQSATLTFTATSGQTVALNMSTISSTPANQSYGLYVYNASGTQVGTVQSATGATLNLTNLSAGTYTVRVVPANPTTATLQVALYSGAGGALTSGVSMNASTSAPGQNAYLSFTGTAGQNVALALTGLVFTPSSATYYSFVTVNKPDGTTLTYNYCYVSNNGCVFSMLSLPATGTYTVVVAPGGAATMSFAALLSPDVLGTLTQGTPLSLNLSSPGQCATLSFTATASQSVALNMSAISSSPANQPYTLYAYNPSGSQIGSVQSATGATLNLSNLPAGTYTARIVPVYPTTASMQVGY